MTLEELEKLLEWISENFMNPKQLRLNVIEDDYPAMWADPRLIEPWIRQTTANKLAEARTYLPKLLAVAKAARAVPGNWCNPNYSEEIAQITEALAALEG